MTRIVPETFPAEPSLNQEVLYNTFTQTHERLTTRKQEGNSTP